jgi:flagellar biosynthesis protein FlhG
MRNAEYKLGYKYPEKQGCSGNAAQTIVVISGNPGAGKTSIALNIAQALSLAGRKILLLDADLGTSSIDTLLDLRREFTLFDVLNGSKNLDEVLLHGPDGIRLVYAASSAEELAGFGLLECAGLVRAFSNISSPVDTLVIDTASGNGECVARLCRAASEVIVTVCSDAESLKSGAALIESLQQDYGIARFRVLPNRVGTTSEASDLFGWLLHHFAANHDVMLSCCGFIPQDEHVEKAALKKQSVITAYPRSRSAMALRNLADQIMRWPRFGSAGGHLEFFVERLIQNENINEEVRS